MHKVSNLHSTGLLPFKMPIYYGTTSTTEMSDTGVHHVKVHFWKPLLLLTFFYYVISCGIERIYQPMVCISIEVCQIEVQVRTNKVGNFHGTYEKCSLEYKSKTSFKKISNIYSFSYLYS